MPWFDNELKRHFGVDVYQYDFDKERGYSTIQKGDVEVLIIKFEKMKEVGEKCIGEFIGDTNFKINDYNISKDKWYSPLFAVIPAMIAGRIVAGGVLFALLKIYLPMKISPMMFVWGGITTGIPGLIVQIILIPILYQVLARNLKWYKQ